MTKTAQRPRFLLVLALALLVLPAAAWADDAQDPKEPPDWVAKVRTPTGWNYLTRRNLASAVLWRSRFGLKEKGNPAVTVLRQLVQEKVVEQEARRLGIRVTQEEVTAKYKTLDTKVRRETNGAKNLHDVITKDEKVTVREFWKQLWHLAVKEKVASHQNYIGPLPKDENAKLNQIEIVIAALLDKAKVEYGLPTALQTTPSKLAQGVIATVNGEPITAKEFGEELVIRLKRENILEVIRQECQAALTARWALSSEEMKTIIEDDRARWLKKREMAEQEAMRTVSYEDYLKMKFKLDLEALLVDRYFRGLYGLVRGFERQVEEKEVREKYELEKNGLYGDGYRVTDIEIGFAPKDALLGRSQGRSRAEALAKANQVLRRIHSQEPVDQIIRHINAGRDPTFRARRLQVRNAGTGRLLYEQARILKDGQTTRPFETLAEVHILRREAAIPAPTYDDVKDMIREGLSFRRARDWIQAQLKDDRVVHIRWPLEDMEIPR